jgi:hypothetical protein
MKGTLKTICLTAATAFSIFSVTVFNACKEDLCHAVTCAYGGVCDNGECLCKSGYEGALCETETRKKFLDVWHVMEDGSLTDANQYGVTIEPGSLPNEIRIVNFRNVVTEPVDAYVKGDSLFIPLQTKGMFTVEGYGWIRENKYYNYSAEMNMMYKVTDNRNGNVEQFGFLEGTYSEWVK